MPEPRPPRPSAPDYRLYIDESGDHTYQKIDQPWHRHLGLLGVWFRCRPDYEEFSDALTGLKRRVFGLSPDDTLVLHRSEIKGRKGRFGVLRDPAMDRKFCDELLTLVENSRFVMAAAILDKQAHRSSERPPDHPYHRSVLGVLECYGFWLAERGMKGDAMIETRGAKEDRSLQAAHYQAATAGTVNMKPATAERVFTSQELKIRTKDHRIDGLQLADLLAHPIKRMALLNSGAATNLRGGFAAELAATAWPKLRQSRAVTTTDCGLTMI